MMCVCVCVLGFRCHLFIQWPSTGLCVFSCSPCSSKGSTLSRRACKKASETSGKGDESGRAMEGQVPLEDLERNQKILQWMMEGDRQRKSSHG